MSLTYSKDDFFKQVNKFLTKKGDIQVTLKDFEKLYEAAQGYRIHDDVDELVEKIILNLFSVPYSSDVLIPWSFWDTPVGQAIAAIKFNMERIYFVNEFAELYGCSETYIFNEIKRGKLKAINRGKRNIVLAEGEINRYLSEKGKPNVTELKKIRRYEVND